MMPSVAALSLTELTARTTWETELEGKIRCSSVTSALDSSARPASPSRASARNVRGRNERSAKYAIIAARCVPRSAKNLAKGREKSSGTALAVCLC